MRSTIVLLTAAVVFVALSVTSFGPFGIFFGAILLAVALYVRDAKSRWRAVGIVTLVALTFMVLFGLLIMPRYSCSTGWSRQFACMRNLRNLAWGLHDYKTSNGTLPPPRQIHTAGRPACSWRVLILPYLQEQDLFQQYNRGEPWDGPTNIKLSREMPRTFACPCDHHAAQHGMTSYVAVVDSAGGWIASCNFDRGKRIATGPNPVLLAEIRNSQISWLEPRGISLDDLCKAAADPSPSGPCYTHVFDRGYSGQGPPLGFGVVFADGSTGAILPGKPAEGIRAALAGDRTKQKEFIRFDLNEASLWKWYEWAALAGLLVSFVTMLAWPRLEAGSSAEPQGGSIT